MVREKTEWVTMRELLALASVFSPLEQNKDFRRWWFREGTVSFSKEFFQSTTLWRDGVFCGGWGRESLGTNIA